MNIEKKGGGKSTWIHKQKLQHVDNKHWLRVGVTDDFE